MTRLERTGWRDEALSARHRLYGENCPMLDIDFLACEFNTGKPVVLVEYKAGGLRRLDFKHPNYQALRHLADASRIPFIIAFYSTLWSYTVIPLNDFALEWFTKGEQLSELEYVRRLYALRGRELPARLEFRLNDVLPEVSHAS